MVAVAHQKIICYHFYVSNENGRKTMRNNKTMLKAQSSQKDEFYTKRETIEKELIHYKKYLKNQIVYCNCDDPRRSQFWIYLKENFKNFKLKALISTFYSETEVPFKTVVKCNSAGRLYTRQTPLKGNGDFSSQECLEILNSATVVVTNPPFSKLKHFIPLMYEYDKKFLILGNQNVLTYREVQPFVMKDKFRYGISIHSGGTEFEVPQEYSKCKRVDEDGKRYASVTGVRWLTNIRHGYAPEALVLHTKKYHLSHNNKLVKCLKNKFSQKTYPKYDNCNALEVPFSECVPSDYKGVMGVPISFMDKYNPEQFRIVGFRKGDNGKDLAVGGKSLYCRMLIERV